MIDAAAVMQHEIVMECRSAVCEGKRTPHRPLEAGLLGKAHGWKCGVCGGTEPERSIPEAGAGALHASR